MISLYGGVSLLRVADEATVEHKLMALPEFEVADQVMIVPDAS